MKTTRALITLGRTVEMEYKAQMCKKNNIQVPMNFKSDKTFFTGLGYQDLMQRRVVAARQMTDAEAWTSSWTQATRSQIGGILVDCLMEVSKVTRTATDKTTGEIMWVSFFSCSLFLTNCGIDRRNSLHSITHTSTYGVRSWAFLGSILLLRRAWLRIVYGKRFIPATYLCSSLQSLGWVQKWAAISTTDVCSSFRTFSSILIPLSR